MSHVEIYIHMYSELPCIMTKGVVYSSNVHEYVPIKVLANVSSSWRDFWTTGRVLSKRLDIHGESRRRGKTANIGDENAWYIYVYECNCY